MKKFITKTSLISFTNFILIIAMTITTCATVRAQNIQPLDKRLEHALLDENWENVVNLLRAVDTQTPSPVLRLIKGHACLARNLNNESLCLFLSVYSDDDFQKWQEWTRDFVNKHPDKAIVYYFRGDAFARLENWDSASNAFNQALEIHPSHPLVLNARGVVNAAKGHLANARVDFDEATKHPEFPLADAYANIGSLCIQKKDGAEGAIKAFNKALEISPNFALALHGRGCVKIVHKPICLFTVNVKPQKNLNDGYVSEDLKAVFKDNEYQLSQSVSVEVKQRDSKWLITDEKNIQKYIVINEKGILNVYSRVADAKKDFKDANERGTCIVRQMAENAIRIAAYWSGMEEKEFLAIHSGKESGTTFNVTYNDVLNSFDNFKSRAGQPWFGQRSFNDFATKFARLSPAQKEHFQKNHVIPTLSQNPTFEIHFGNGQQKYFKHHEHGGFADMAADQIKMIGGILAGAGATGAMSGMAAAPSVGLIAGGIGVNAIGTKMEAWNGLHKNNINDWKAINHKLGINPQSISGGVDTSLAGIDWEEGEWPFVEFFGLLYRMKSEEISSQK